MLQHRILGTSALLGLLALPVLPARAQAVPNPGKRVESLVIFGAQSDRQWGDDAFAYEYCFRLPATASKPTVPLYPFVSDKVASIMQSNYDVDNAATLSVFSVAKNGRPGTVSGDGVWTSSTLPIAGKEHGLSFDFRLASTKPAPNDMVMYVTDQ